LDQSWKRSQQEKKSRLSGKMKRKRKVGRSRRHDRPHLREEKRRKKSKRKNDTTATDRGATVDLGRDRDHHAQGRDETVRRIPDTAQDRPIVKRNEIRKRKKLLFLPNRRNQRRSLTRMKRKRKAKFRLQLSYRRRTKTQSPHRV